MVPELWTGSDLHDFILTMNLKTNFIVKCKITPFFEIGPSLHYLKQSEILVSNPNTGDDILWMKSRNETILGLNLSFGFDIN